MIVCIECKSMLIVKSVLFRDLRFLPVACLNIDHIAAVITVAVGAVAFYLLVSLLLRVLYRLFRKGTDYSVIVGSRVHAAGVLEQGGLIHLRTSGL